MIINLTNLTATSARFSAQVLDLGDSFGGAFSDRGQLPGECFEDTALIFARNLFVLGITVAILLAVFQAGRGGLDIASSGGDQEKVQQGSARLRNALLGVGAMFVVIILVLLVVSIFVPELTLPAC